MDFFFGCNCAKQSEQVNNYDQLAFSARYRVYEKKCELGFFLYFPGNCYFLAIVLYELLGTFWAHKCIH